MLQSLYLTLKFQEIREVIQNNQIHEIIIDGGFTKNDIQLLFHDGVIFRKQN